MVSGIAAAWNGTVKDRLPVSPEAENVWLATAPGTGAPFASSLTVTVAGMGVPGATATVE